MSSDRGESSRGAGGRLGEQTTKGWTDTEDYDKQEREVGMAYGVRIQKRSMATTHH